MIPPIDPEVIRALVPIGAKVTVFACVIAPLLSLLFVYLLSRADINDKPEE